MTSPRPERRAVTLFVSGAAPRSTQAITTVREVCDHAFDDALDLTVIDAATHPALALEHDVVALPTLVKVSPRPVRHLVGNLTDAAHVSAWLHEVLPDPRQPAATTGTEREPV